MKVFAALLLLVCSLTAASAQTFRFGGEDYVQKFEVKGRAPNRQVEFGLPREPIEKWTRLVTVHYFTRNGNDATRAATVLANLVRDRYKGSKYKVINNPKTGEAIIDFLIPVPNTELMEFNVFKYAPTGNELVALQFAQRVKLGEIDGEDMRKLRDRAIQEMANYDMGPVKAFVGK
jgi:hypothetical protein